MGNPEMSELMEPRVWSLSHPFRPSLWWAQTEVPHSRLDFPFSFEIAHIFSPGTLLFESCQGFLYQFIVSSVSTLAFESAKLLRCERGLRS